VIKETAARITLSTRSGLTYELIKEKGVWKISSFEEMVAQYIQTLEENREIIRENIKEMKHRRKLNLPLPDLSPSKK
jgi:hypothetical protein